MAATHEWNIEQFKVGDRVRVRAPARTAHSFTSKPIEVPAKDYDGQVTCIDTWTDGRRRMTVLPDDRLRRDEEIFCPSNVVVSVELAETTEPSKHRFQDFEVAGDEMLFSAYERTTGTGYVYIGRFRAPAGTAERDLGRFIPAVED